MENLTKQQIILLTLLVSFVTSIATGIVTVSLLDQAPKAVTETINHVVEKTIEHVVQVPSQASAITVQKETVVVKQDDETVSAIEKNSKSIVRIYSQGVSESNPEPHSIFQAIGFVISKDGIVASDASLVGLTNLSAQFQDGTVFPVAILSAAEGSSTVLIKLTKPEKSDYVFVPATLGDSNGLKLGQSVIMLGGRSTNSVSLGIISSLKTDAKSDSSASTTPKISNVLSVVTTISPLSATLGAPLITLSGEVVGIVTGVDQLVGIGSFSPSQLLLSQLQGVINSLPKSTSAGAKN